MSKLPACPHCGSHKVETVDEFYRCTACNQDFGRVATADSGKPMVDEVTGLRFRYGDYITGSVTLRIAEDEGAVVFEVYDAQMNGLAKVADVLPNEEWFALKKRLFETMYAGDWDRIYYPVNDGKELLDNNSWELDFIVSDTEVHSIKGFSEKPAYWNELLAVLEPYFNKLATLD